MTARDRALRDRLLRRLAAATFVIVFQAAMAPPMVPGFARVSADLPDHDDVIAKAGLAALPQ